MNIALIVTCKGGSSRRWLAGKTRMLEVRR
ncbi:hypothetical protein OOU_Y34scaffold00540g13 [Pyricularia oryzae Y34]|uniref:Uncharacterized protein n=2 Tax=Pyricularia oryzae TaxID=318829 RepID=A0AA97PL45_PYRO3|nr:hypothetical protein OOU_Y34scaffold00540g13 [Pyricularia oryzae Y34]